MRKRLAFITIALLLTSTVANAWWDAAWGYRKSVTVDTTANGANVTAPTTDVPVLVRLHTGNFTHFLELTERGGDIRFLASDDTTLLKHHVERFDAVNELAFVWVRMPTVQGGSDANKVWMYFGNPAGTQAEDLVGTYGPTDAMVLHYDEASGTPQDKTANGNNAVSFTGQQNPGSLIGSGARLGGNGSVTINDSPSLKAVMAQGWTFSTWTKIDAPQSDAVLMDRVDGTMQLSLGIDGTNAYAKFVDGAGTATETPRTAALTPGTWHHVALVITADKLSVFIDGNETATIAGTFADIGGSLTIGSAADGSRYVTADIDETRVANVARSAAQLMLMARTEGMDSKAVVYSADETPETEGATEAEAHGPSTFGIILNSVFGNKEAVVEQAVIGFCGLMALVAFAVMVLKFIYLTKAKTASRKFLKAYESLGTDGKGANIASLAKEAETYGDSPLFRLYSLGINEVRKRLQRANAAGAKGATPPVLSAAERAAAGPAIVELCRKLIGNRTETVAAGTRIFNEGDPSGGFMFVLLEGEVDIFVRGKRIDGVGAGACLGEVGLLDNGPRSATTVAKTGCVLAKLNAKQFQELVKQAPDFSRAIMQTLVDRLRTQREGMESKSVEAVRASLDAAMVREGQKLNSQMVLLTIAISGGPFIGLLGTVVGVMVTFAAIAASGDVNINAIAPGMAAALLATTAGLAVAIPALFGYNYLGSIIKEVSADMRVFSDEFIARINELYGR